MKHKHNKEIVEYLTFVYDILEDEEQDIVNRISDRAIKVIARDYGCKEQYVRDISDEIYENNPFI